MLRAVWQHHPQPDMVDESAIPPPAQGPSEHPSRCLRTRPHHASPIIRTVGVFCTATMDVNVLMLQPWKAREQTKRLSYPAAASFCVKHQSMSRESCLQCAKESSLQAVKRPRPPAGLGHQSCTTPKSVLLPESVPLTTDIKHQLQH
jgi:hypothetical protein